jgi:hypothetical protein
MKNLYDDVLSGVDEIVTDVSNEIAKEFKGATPFDSEKIKESDLFNAYQNMTEEDMSYFLSKYDRDTINDFMFNMQQYGRKANAATISA